MDFKHPFISNPRLSIYYIVFWLVASTAGVLTQWLAYGTDPGNAIVEMMSSILLFAVIGTAIWYVIKVTSIEKTSIARLLVTHGIAATIIVLIWLYLGIVVIKIFHPDAHTWLNNSVPIRAFMGYMFYVVFVVFFYAITYYQNFKDKVTKEGELKALVKEAELHALKSQINPHFLFNSLNSISSLTISDPERAQEMVINLSTLMRYSLKYDQNEIVNFGQELENNKLYLQIEKVRFGKKLNPVFEIEECCLNASIPNMILQPLYENAIKYGVYETTVPVDVITKCYCKNDLLIIEISNTYDSNVVSKKGEGIGLRNIRDRLKIIFRNPSLLKIKDLKKEFIVTLTIPQK